MAIGEHPRFRLAALPTPLQRCRHLEKVLHAPPLFVKRDDLTGFLLAGNKARKLEFLIADAQQQGCDMVVSGGGPGSNHCQATAGAARVAGMGCRLVLYGNEPKVGHPNLALMRFLGAEICFTGSPERSSVDEQLPGVAAGLEAAGHRPYVIPRGGASPVGALGYALAAEELAGQLAESGVEIEALVLSVGSGGTYAGLLAATAGSAQQWRLVGASVSRPVPECRSRVQRLASACRGLLGAPQLESYPIEIHDARGPGYGTASNIGLRAARLAAEAEGLLLDPVYTAKGFAQLLHLVDDGISGPTVFIHTGGTVEAVFEAESNRDDGSRLTWPAKT